MRKLLIVMVALMIAGSVGIAACAPGGEAKIQPCTVELADVYPLFGGKESVTLAAVFDVKNPNEFLVILDTLEYTIAATKDNKVVAAAQLADDLYIPGGTEIRVTSAFTVPVSNLIAELMMGQGLPKEQAVPAAMPTWKQLGGLLIADPLEPMWDTWAGPEACPYKAEGTIYLASFGGQKLDTQYTATWMPKP